MGIIAWIILGGLAGWISSMIVGTNASMGLAANIFVGILGAFIGGFLFSVLGGSDVNGFNIYSLLVAIVGSVVLLMIVQLFQKQH
jgi:uncharacterized membrane protein YeaQ/YmgE (transglycosylase-associated protein family)